MKLTRDFRALLLVVLLGVPAFAQADQEEDVYLRAVLMNGEQFNLQQQRGKVVMINFWATWCPNCRAEFPIWQRVYDDYRNRDFVMIAVSIDRNKKDLDKFLKKNPYTVPIAWRFDQRGDDTFPKVRATPTTYFIGRNGEVALEQLGPMGDAKLRSTLEGLLEP